VTVQHDADGAGITSAAERDVRCAPELVIVGLGATTPEDAIRALAGAATSSGYGRSSLPDAVVAREREFPTALPTTIPVAIPHADAEHVRRPGLALATFARPVQFIQMGTDDIRLDVTAMFMPLVTDPRRQTAFLARLIDLLQKDEWKTRIDRATSAVEVALSINELLYER
jgi:PTS system galactitol-specific IIA component